MTGNASRMASAWEVNNTYSDKLVRDFIEKIEVFPNTLRVTLKAGISTMVKL